MLDAPVSSPAVDAWKLLDSLPDQLVVIDRGGQPAYANASWRRFARQYFGSDWRDMSVLAGYRSAGDAAGLEAAVRQVLEGERDEAACEISLQLAGSAQVFAAQVSAYEHAGGRSALVQQRPAAADAELERQREFTRVLLDNLSDAVVASDADGRLVLFNQAARRWHRDATGEELVPETWAKSYQLLAGDGVTPLPLAEAPLRRALKGEQVREAGMAFVADSGHRRFIEASADPLINDQGQRLGAVVVMHDITDRKNIQEAQRELQELIIRSQEEALSELSTPLFPIARQAMVMPLIGTIDSRRAALILETLLDGVARHRARLVILDITGVPLVDSQVANTLIQAARAAGLLGAQVVLTGIRPEVAQTIVGLGIDLAAITTLASLESGVAYALERLRLA
ncbi:MAG TPA: PAS domain-containing protein [Herpetosiphonaceae bacterium]